MGTARRARQRAAAQAGAFAQAALWRRQAALWRRQIPLRRRQAAHPWRASVPQAGRGRRAPGLRSAPGRPPAAPARGGGPGAAARADRGAHRQGHRPRRHRLAPRRRGDDRGGPRDAQRRGARLAGRQRDGGGPHHDRRRAAAAARAHPLVDLPQAARARHHRARSAGACDRVRQPSRGPAARRGDRAARHQHRGPAPPHQRRRPRPRHRPSRHGLAAPLQGARPRRHHPGASSTPCSAASPSTASITGRSRRGSTASRATMSGSPWACARARTARSRRILEHLGLGVNRLIRLSFGPFQLGDLEPGLVEEVRTKVLREQLGQTLAEEAGVDFESPVREPIAPFGTKPETRADERPARDSRPPRGRDDDRPRRPRDGERPFRARAATTKRAGRRAPRAGSHGPRAAAAWRAPALRVAGRGCGAAPGRQSAAPRRRRQGGSRRLGRAPARARRRHCGRRRPQGRGRAAGERNEARRRAAGTETAGRGAAASPERRRPPAPPRRP